ncbi:hypothetical protein [Psychrobacter sp. Cmf 22.2]|uniref:hypothetical protein n=1 Tax=Psychrobacter sp. Cmf 22.2 TaxID=1926478 RepID=UPI000946D092|nr:hypothetical protein [Psychrobacter sp. Cmf 22.2]OLF38374.1 hypothetical protein BTV98_05950 [Psychrobacter sp. Cmf 22.2]
MATLYQLHSTMDRLRRSTEEMALTWRAGDSIILLGATVAFIEWLHAYLSDSDIEGIAGIYALADDVAQLSNNTTAKLNLNAKLTGVLTDNEWVTMTQDPQFDKVVTIAL